jgi:hypothetical protein
MKRFIAMTEVERRDAFEAAASLSGLPAASIEKDFWVTWTLRELFALPEWGPQLTFKGGTSLSKCWKLIDRFSEDIDVVVDREFLGFGGDNLSGKKLEKLRAACAARVHASLLPSLDARFKSALPAGAEWSVAAALDDPDDATLLFRYPTVYRGRQGYVAPVVRIELGARSDTEPHETPLIGPLLADSFPTLFDAARFPVKAVAARRTFWEKALLLHEETFRPTAKEKRRPRLSRHYYDVHRLVEQGVAADAVAEPGLLERVVAHRRIFFKYAWIDYAAMKRGSLRMMPLPEKQAEWRKDYEAMRAEMFYGDPPTFDVVLATVRRFQDKFNES